MTKNQIEFSSYIFDQNGLLKSAISKNSAGDIIYTDKYIYDSNNTRIKKLSKYRSGQVREVIYDCDEDRAAVEFIRYPNGTVIKNSYRKDGTCETENIQKSKVKSWDGNIKEFQTNRRGCILTI